jgi:hypothetical protein
MGLLEYIKDMLRSELPVKQSILEREKRFNNEDPSRESWILNHTYLCEGNLEELKRHPSIKENYKDKNIGIISTHYEPISTGPAKKVIVRVPMSSDRISSTGLVEKVLKLDLNSRGCNAGVFYKRFEKGEYLYAQAVPATISGGL